MIKKKTLIRMKPSLRKQKILKAAIELAIQKGYQNLTRNAVAEASESSFGLIHHYFESISNLKHEVLKEAIRLEIMPILIENLSAKELPISFELKQKVIQHLIN